MTENRMTDDRKASQICEAFYVGACVFSWR